MSEIILHHYAPSPYAEKIRLALGRKGLAWRSVSTPMVLPKEDHFELTGGYRRVPVLQIGADIYCDSHLIGRVLDRLHPSPPLTPPGQATVENALSRWAETNFMMVVLAFFGIGHVFPPEFIEDRKKTMIAPGTDLDGASKILPTKLLQLRDNILRLESMLEDGRAFILGEEPCMADLSAYHPLMMLGLHEKTQALLAGADKVGAWMKRVRAIGHSESTKIESAEAIEEARAASPAAYTGEPILPEGMQIGTPVIVLHDDYGSGHVQGELAASGLDEIAIRRRGERTGDIVVHFPRQDYSVIALG